MIRLDTMLVNIPPSRPGGSSRWWFDRAICRGTAGLAEIRN
jgi:hypothetical protein